MRCRKRNCTAVICFGAGLLVASLLPTKAVCVIAAVVLVITCLGQNR